MGQADDGLPTAIHAVLAEPKGGSSLLPTLPVLPSASSYLPSQLSSLSTTFTSAGTLPRSAIPAGKSVAQRRAQAPPIQVSELRKVPKTDFDAYLAEIREEYDRWQHEARIAAAEADAEASEIQNGSSRAGGRSRGTTHDEVLPPLDDIPRIFFDTTFNLSNPRTFDLVTERIQLTPTASPNLSKLSAAFDAAPTSEPSRTSFDHVPGLGPETLQDLAADQILQDKLSHYTAVIESHLVREIGLRSSSFFAALSNLQSLHQQGEDALGKIAELQGTLSTERGGVGSTAKHGLQILQAQARRRGLERIEESVRAVDEIWTAVEGVKELVENGEWDGALEVSEQIEGAYYASSVASSSTSRAVNGDHRPSLPHPASSSGSLASTAARRSPPRRAVNLTKIRALASLPSKLALLRAQIAKSLEGELVTVLEHELDTGIDEHVKLAKAGRRWKGKEREKDARSSTQVLAIVREDESEDASDDIAPETRATERITDRVRPVVRALVRADGMDNAVTAWRESVLREIRALVREHLPTAETPGLDDDDSFATQAAIRSVSKQSVDLGSISEKSLSLAKKLRALSHADFVALARETYLGLLACIELVNLQAQVLVAEWQTNRRDEAERRQTRRGAPADPPAPNPASSSAHLAVPSGLESYSSPSPDQQVSLETRSTSSDDATTLATEITDVVHAVAELANVRFSKVIGVRTEVHAQLALADFVQIFDLSWDFVVQCERICQRMIVGLRGAMVAQAKTFLQAFHQRQITENARVVEEEQWAAVEVGPNVQACVARIIQIAMSDPPDLLLGSRSTALAQAATPPSQSGDAGISAESDPSSSAPAGPAKQIDIEGKQFFAVSAGLTTIVALMEYLKVLVNAPMLTTDVMSKIIEFMKVFNSRTCQVVLGAGAMRSAGLKNITAKHLALASQALSIMVSLIPYIREGVRRHLNPKQAVMLTEFDKLKRDYQEHQHEIHAKLIAIMSDRLHVHSRTLESINWEEPVPQAGSPNAYMEALVKEHTTLHKVLSRFLHAETVLHIMTQVFAALDAKLAEMYGKVELKSQGAQDRMLVDVRYLASKLGGLKSLEENGPGKTLETLVQSKHVPRPVPPLPVRSPSPAKVAAPARTSSIQPETSQAVTPAEVPQRAAEEEPSAIPPPTQSSRTSSPCHSTEAAREGTSSEPPASPPARKSIELHGPDSPASSANTPLTSSSAASSAPSSPTISNSTSTKRKTLAARLVESMSRKANAHAAVPATPSNSVAAASAARELQQMPAPEPAHVTDTSEGDVPRISDLPAPPQILQEGLDTPTLEKTLALDVETEVPLPTPTVEELDAAERDIAATSSEEPTMPTASDDSTTVAPALEALGGLESGSALVENETRADAPTDDSAAQSAETAADPVEEDASLLPSAPEIRDDRVGAPERATEPATPTDDGARHSDGPQDSPSGADTPSAPESGVSPSPPVVETTSVPEISISPAVDEQIPTKDEVSPAGAAQSAGIAPPIADGLVNTAADQASPSTPPLVDATASAVSGPEEAPSQAGPSEADAKVVTSPIEVPAVPAAPASQLRSEDTSAQLRSEDSSSETMASPSAPTEVSEPPAPVPKIATTSPIPPVVSSAPPTSPPPTSPSPASPPPVNGTRKKTLKERLEEAARRRNSPSSTATTEARTPSTPTKSAAREVVGRPAASQSANTSAGTAAVDSKSTGAEGLDTTPPPAAVESAASPDSSARAGDSKTTEGTVDGTEERQTEKAEESLL
ncbi:hypothetical protein JCM10908_004288 [Rhodotorula pacifica]|uniref:uncharacterized protein n=1 Tax=Rhodotorula pacifica TaxID=1495444 RepID=UPI0031717065